MDPLYLIVRLGLAVAECGVVLGEVRNMVHNTIIVRIVNSMIIELLPINRK